MSRNLLQNTEKKPKTIYLSEYQAPVYHIESAHLTFEINEDYTRVSSELTINRVGNDNGHAELFLHGEELELISISLDNKLISASEYTLSDEGLTLHSSPKQFNLQIEVNIKPHLNLQLSGLYRSNKMFCTQCEAEGFRRITYFLDRPDNLTFFTTKIIADRIRYPILLSNGNPIDKGQLSDNRHYIEWEDPFKKPSYLFALVAGDLACIEDSFTTCSGRNIKLAFYVEHQNKHKCDFAVASLKKSMSWDEQNYGREYDLDIYMVVAVNDFNMGAMENKGLNIFNSKYVLADKECATDQDFEGVEVVIGHEYFHNWTGNRITCRDWFQLSLKEGLTVFREQQFNADQGRASVKRIDDVKSIRSRQFSEDAGPLAHPVQPKSYIEINNFYTMTVYYKGAEVVRMLHTLLGEQQYIKGIEHYFKQYDGQAVTIEAFILAFEQVNNLDLSQFKRWYDQAGTPTVALEQHYDEQEQTLTLTASQSCEPTPESSQKLPFVVPMNISFFTQSGDPIHIEHNQLQSNGGLSCWVLTQETQTLSFNNVPNKPIVSVFGGFSAPVKVDIAYTNQELARLIECEQDGFNQWNACDRLMCNAILSNKLPSKELINALKNVLENTLIDPALVSRLLTLPHFSYLAEQCQVINANELQQSLKAFHQSFSSQLLASLKQAYQRAIQSDRQDFSAESIGVRALMNSCLWHCVQLGDSESIEWAKLQFTQAKTMSAQMGALSALNQCVRERDAALSQYYSKWQQEPLLVNKWLGCHAVFEGENALENIQNVMQHPAFKMDNPNNVYALINSFAANNAVVFHQKNGASYDFLAQCVIEIDSHNAQVASRVCEHLTHWHRFAQPQQSLMRKALEKIAAQTKLSNDIYELVNKSL